MTRSTENSLVIATSSRGVPAIIERSGGSARFAYDEFFKATINNEHTRRAYKRIVGRLLAWCETNDIELRQITPSSAGDYISQVEGSAPTKNQALAALRHFFDAMVTRHVVPLNSFASVRGVRHSVTEGKTAEISIEQARKFSARSMSVRPWACAIAPCSASLLTRAHASALRAGLKLSDYRDTGEQRALRFREKGGKDREIPARHDLQEWINEYIAAAGIGEASKATPLFRSTDKTKALTAARYAAHSIRQMMKRRLADAGLPELFSPHSFRVTVVTDLLNQNVPLEDVQYLAGHSSPMTTRIYDRRRRRVTRNIVERISI